MYFDIDYEDKEILLLMINRAIEDKPDYLVMSHHKLNNLLEKVEDGYDE